MQYYVADELIKLKHLLDDGILTTEEFERQKQILLNSTKEVEETKYDLYLESYNPKYGFDVAAAIMEIKKISLKEAKRKYMNKVPIKLVENITIEESKKLKVRFDKCRASISVKPQEDSTNNIVSEITELNCGIQLRCPKCGSSSVVIGTRGFSVITGFVGSNKTMNRCGACGYKWRP